VPEFIDQRFSENKPKTLIFSHRKRAFLACFRENRDYNFRHRKHPAAYSNKNVANTGKEQVKELSKE
jgi:hypothetical protein